jgi:hypothetical protein
MAVMNAPKGTKDLRYPTIKNIEVNATIPAMIPMRIEMDTNPIRSDVKIDPGVAGLRNHVCVTLTLLIGMIK